MRRTHLLLLAAILAGCSSVPRYEEPSATAGGLAVVEGVGSMLSLCGITDNSVCKAGVRNVDGQNAGGSTSLRVAAGEHEIELICTAKTGISLGDMIWFTRRVRANFLAGSKYQIKAHWNGAECLMDLVDAATGKPIVAATGAPL